MDHPICVELSDEELSWIEQQISFATSKDSRVLNGGVVSGGAANLVDEDVLEVGGKLAELVEDWPAEEVKHIPGVVTSQIHPSIGLNIANEINQVFVESISPTESTKKSTPNDAIKEVTHVDVSNQQPPENTPQSKGPRTATRIRRAKKRVIARNTDKLHKQTISAAAQSNIALPNFSPIPVAKSNRGAIGVDLDSRSDKMASALENMLKNPLRTRSRELSQAFGLRG